MKPSVLEMKQLEFVKTMIEHYFGGRNTVMIEGWPYRPAKYLNMLGIIDSEGQVITEQQGFLRTEAVKYFQELAK